MPEIDLSLVANIQPYINSIKEAQQTYQGFHDTVKKGEKEEEGLIGSTVSAIDEYEKARKKAWTTTDIEKYNKKIAEAKQSLDEYNKLGTKTQEKQESGWKKLTGTFNGVGGMLMKVAGAAGIAFGAFEFGKKILASTDTLADKFEATMGGLNATLGFVAKSIADWDFSNFFEGFKNAYEEGKRYTEMLDELEDRMRSLQISSAASRLEFINLNTAFKDQTKSVKERIAIGEEMILKAKSNSDKEKQLSDDLFKNELTNVERLATANKQLSEADHKRNEENIKFFIQNYNNFHDAVKNGYEDVIKTGEDYNKLIEERDRLERQAALEGEKNYKKTGFFKIEEIRDYSKEIEELTKKIDSASDHEKYWAGVVKIMGNVTDEQRIKLSQLWTNRINTESSGVQEIIRTETMLSGFKQGEIDKEKAAAEKEAARLLKIQEDYLKLSEELRKRYDQAGINALTGRDRIKADEALANEELDRLIVQLQKVGELTLEQEHQIQILRTRIHAETVNKIKEIDDKELIDKQKHNKQMLNASKQLELEIASLSEHAEEEKIAIEIKYNNAEIERLNKLNDSESQIMSAQLQDVNTALRNEQQKLINEREKFSIYQLLGIDMSTEKGKDEARKVDEAASQIKSAINSIMEAEIAASEATVQAIDDKISKKEDELKTEQDLRDKGLANNVDATKKELALLNSEKKKALEEDRKIKKQQIAIDTISETSKLILSATELFSSQAPKGIAGVVIAAGLIASMFAIISSARSKAKALEQETELGEGGYIDEYGVVKGKKHSQGGERLLNQISVEQGEGIGVFNSRATSLYGNMLPKWVASINAMQMPNFDSLKPNLNQSNTYNIETKRMEKKLDSINDGINLLNNNLINSNDLHYVGTKRIQKIGKNHIRIIDVKNGL